MVKRKDLQAQVLSKQISGVESLLIPSLNVFKKTKNIFAQVQQEEEKKSS